MRLVPVLLVLLVSLPVWAQSELPVSGPIRERVLVVWGGGRTREEAESLVESYQERSVDWARALEVGAGYPRIIEGAEVPGLRPGSFIVALGVCEVKAGEEMTKVFTALEPRVSSRRVLWDEREPLACPSLLPGWSFGKSARTRAPGGTVVAAAFNSEGEEAGGRQRSWLLVLALMKKEDVESTVIEPPEDEATSEVKEMRVVRGEVVLEEELMAPTCGTRIWRFSVEKGALKTKQAKKPLRREDCARGQGEAPADG
ncbi:hypothetical protein [Vitiosangium sp. GDMCC 1.1324]|uniref:hypothetical protein n=1 Tax=Vitiosangium sp. (strain GDMCC 1.1324) TaxID=2138576 RepID=UPI000D3B9F55|nr:hypothetical protein [Vitiosangium sp. GDMCC 1.1324]PTL79819.1 hypothetical protein DAT35_30735 [Vitiosangium sp. GDMCC 1.1324]